jgi:hypothetical protein
MQSLRSNGVTEAELGLHIYSLVTKDDLSEVLQVQQTYVENDDLLFFLRELDEGDSEYASMSLIVHRVVKTREAAQSLRDDLATVYNKGINAGGGTLETTITEITYDQFVELQQKLGVKYYFAGLAEVLEDLEG